jgi:N-acetylglucosamine kinase-like BadF-type ATPase
VTSATRPVAGPPAATGTGARHVLGIDVGGTSTRVLVADIDGRQAGAGHAAGANPISHGLETAVASLREALESALASVGPGAIAHAVLGVAGVNAYGDSFGTAVAGVWRATGLRCPATLRPDAEIVYAAGSPAPHGFVLVSGTGAIAAQVRDGAVAAAADGHGWLLGDDGSAFWLGREAVRACLAAGEGSGPATALRGAVARRYDLAPEGRDFASSAVTGAVYQRPPVSLAELAPLVTAEAVAGDQVARGILDRAAAALLRSLATVHRRAGAPTGLPAVLGGGVLLAPGPLGRAVREGVARLGLLPCLATDAAAGAAALAIAALTRRPLSAAAHAGLVGSAG